ncbi:MAG TPA: hypothetical protein VE978_26005, partial [Chitinophagales bacterium]|nr:hypothetical protein [Chitinophagales bacterium]
ELYTLYPVQMFLRWFDQRPIEHQLELSEFIGHFCYEKLFITCETDGAKIFACREYVKSCVGNWEREEKLLLFIDDIIRFIVEVNEIADSGLFACEEVIYELRDIISLYSMINELQQRSNKWLVTYHEWLSFKKNFSFFSDTEPLPEYERLITDLQGNLKRHL